MGTDGVDVAEAIVLDADEREIVALEVAALLPALSGGRRARYTELSESVETGEVPADLAPELASLLELVLQTARARQLYRAEGERVLTELFRRTPRGRELASQLAEVNAALRALAGHTLHGARVAMRTLGHFTVTLSSDAATVALAVRSDGVNIDSISVGEGGSDG